MANRRDLKAMIRNTATELLFACNVCYVSSKEFGEEQFTETSSRIAQLYNEFIARVNHPSGTKDTKLTRQYYRKLVADFDKQTDTFVEELNKVLKA